MKVPGPWPHCQLTFDSHFFLFYLCLFTDFAELAGSQRGSFHFLSWFFRPWVEETPSQWEQGDCYPLCVHGDGFIELQRALPKLPLLSRIQHQINHRTPPLQERTVYSPDGPFKIHSSLFTWVEVSPILPYNSVLVIALKCLNVN